MITFVALITLLSLIKFGVRVSQLTNLKGDDQATKDAGSALVARAAGAFILGTWGLILLARGVA